MAGEVTLSSLSDQTVAAVLNDFALELYTGPGAIAAHPAIVDCGVVDGAATDTIKVPGEFLNGYDRFAALGSETATTSNTGVTDAAYSLTVAPYGLRRVLGDFARLTSKYDRLQRYVLDLVQSDVQTFWYLLTQLVDGFAQVTGTSGAALTWETFLDANTYLDGVDAPAERIMLLHSFQWGELKKDTAFGSGGSWQWQKPSSDMVLRMGTGYQGELGPVTIYTHNSVSLSSGNRLGALWARNAVLTGRATPPADPDMGDVVFGNRVKARKEAIVQTITTGIMGSTYHGLAIGQDARGTVIRSRSSA